MERALEILIAELESDRDKGLYPNITREAAELLYAMVVQSRAQNIVEIGAANGYSTLWLARAARETQGHVITMEWGKDRFAVLSKTIERSGLRDWITAYNEDAKEVLKKIAIPVDFVFIDAMAREYGAYLQLLEPHLHEGSVIVADNTISHKEKLQDFLEYVTMNSRYKAQELGIGKGTLVIRVVE